MIPSLLDFGTIIADKYCLESQIGEGGFGTIWRANQMDLDRPVAIKLVRSATRGSQSLAQKTVTEARVAASVQHRNVVSILDVGLTEEGTPFIVMEYLEGESLADRIDRKPMSVADIVRTAEGALRGLAAVHAAGIVHRDVKPENIFLVYDVDGWFPKLLDFGISKADEATITSLQKVSRTTRERAVGTPQYMSPEQARGLPGIDARSDLFSMGVVLYEALTGELPFDADDPLEVLIAVTRHEPPPVAALRPDLGTAISDVVAKAMAKDPEDRFADARAMRLALEAAFEPERAREPTGRVRLHRRSLETRNRPLSTPPPAADPLVAPPMGVSRPRKDLPTDDAPIRGETVVVDRAPERPTRRWRIAAVASLAGLALLLVAGGATWLLRDPAATEPTHDEPAARPPAHVPPPAEPVQTEPPVAPAPEAAAEAAPPPQPVASPPVDAPSTRDRPGADSRPRRPRASPRRAPRRDRNRPSRRGGVFTTPDF